jgi:hypothetical protein
MPTHYDLLGVPPDADAAEIRAAYLALIKRHHPDAPGGESEEEAVRSRELNLAYSVLKDPAKRARYDMDIDLRRRAAAMPGRAVVAPPPLAPDPRRGSGRTPWAAAIALAGVVGAALALPYFLAPAEPPPPSPELVREDSQGSPGPALVPVNEPEVAEAISDLGWIVVNGAPEDAVIYSRRCHEELRFYANLRMLDWCLAFDLAAAQWLRERRGPVPPFFTADNMRARHERAAAGLSIREEEAERRMLRIAERVIATLAADGVPPG